jgi:hypothetical protein
MVSDAKLLNLDARQLKPDSNFPRSPAICTIYIIQARLELTCQVCLDNYTWKEWQKNESRL